MQTIVIVDDDRGVTEAFAAWLEGPGRQLVLCSDVESAQLVIERNPPACIITDVRLSSPFKYEGLDFIEHIKRYAPASRIVLMTGASTEGLEQEALGRGADAVLHKPFDLEELDRHLPPADGAESTEPASVVRVASIDDVTESALLVPSFQPIVDLASGSFDVFAYESLARFRGPILSDPSMLFEYAARKGRIVDLELACIRHTFAEAWRLPSRAMIFMNLHPAVMSHPELGVSLTASSEQSGIEPGRVVLEITEQASLGDSPTVRRQCDELRARGFAFALDDMGMAYSHLAHIEQIRPSFLKVSQEFGSSFETSPTRTKIVRNVLSLARDFGCGLVLEGIETPDTARAARALGVRLGQGFYFGRPTPADELG